MTRCGCVDCGVVELLIAAGRCDLAVRHAHAAGLLTDGDIEAAFLDGRPPVELLAFARHEVTR